ncbi:hypothetical protein THOG05_40035 [Vibrio rotiferianus]|nr:hypothetical protein THOG05_40035 [Vibrio rotiferianus]
MIILNKISTIVERIQILWPATLHAFLFDMLHSTFKMHPSMLPLLVNRDSRLWELIVIKQTYRNDDKVSRF